jgi:hypothetical protein
MFTLIFASGEGNHPRYPFSTFQNLPDLVQMGLAWGTEQQIAGIRCDFRDVCDWIIGRYNVQYGSLDRRGTEQESIGSYLMKLDIFLVNSVHGRMVRCYVDNQCDMLKAKLAWTEDY